MTHLPINDPRDWTDADFDYAWGLLIWHRAMMLRIMRRGLALGLLIGALLMTTPALAADPAYCQLWAREYVRVQLTSFTPADRAEVIARGKADLERSLARDYAICLNEDEYPKLPNVVASSDAFYLESLWTNLNGFVARETVPKRLEPVVVPVVEISSGDDPDWVARCKARFKTFDESTGMVLMWKDPRRHRRGSERVRCPEER